jgi:sugar phosphate isomerase/epimerase
MAGRLLGTMIAYGFPGRDLARELDLAHEIRASVLEILPDWAAFPDPIAVRHRSLEAGLSIHSAHGCWGGRTIRASRVDLGSVDPECHRQSVDDLKACIDWLAVAGGRCLVVHPGGLSKPDEFAARRAALGQGLRLLAAHARGTGVVVCVENMPPGVYPGSRMADLTALLEELALPELALALDTGHSNLTSSVELETSATGGLLATTHVHDNDGRKDSHQPPGHGTIDWSAWGVALDEIGYDGPIMLECIRHLRDHPGSFRPSFLEHVGALPTGSERRGDRL